MKRYIVVLISIAFFFIAPLSAQYEIDALRFSQTNITGTSKSVAMAGALGAVGADFTSLSSNPAGIGIYRSSEFSFSSGINWNNTKSEFLNSSNKDDVYKSYLGNLGLVFYNKKNRETGWLSTNFGIGYNRVNSFNQNIYMRGINNSNSYLDNFTDYANEFDQLDPFYEQLALDADLIYYDEDLEKYSNDIMNANYGQEQLREYSSRGHIGEYSFTYGANYNNRFYIGATLGINKLNFEQNIKHTESDLNSSIDYLSSFLFEEYLNTNGTGYNAKFGIIARPLNALRIGIAFHLPTYYYLTEEYENIANGYFDSEPDTRAYSGMNNYDYRLRTPSKAVFSAAITIRKMAMISIDYELINYRKANLDASDDNFYETNNVIEQLYNTSSNLKIGGELKINSLYLRGGYAFFGSPYASNEPNVDSNINQLSAGIGFKNKSFFIDAGYSHLSNQSTYYMYFPQMTEGSLNTSENSVAQLTLGFKF